MKSVNQFTQIYLHRLPVDFRKSINGLSFIVQEEMKLNPFEEALFVFCCQKQKRLKILYWDKTGFALWTKRLEEARFIWPRKQIDSVVTITSRQLEWLLEGIDVWKLRPHEECHFSSTV